ncbi:MAG TPA: pyridoxine 5'-phosphate synthase [Bacteroidia bacterium]|jgi:pyridoxine 5-phosphate synthase|nr:pyridoxine 5'-phosphate synthase [Bacteroidia bacterium]
MPKLSVNINKIATLRNARGGQVPDVLKVAADCERFGAEGITVHPRPDERHIRYSDVMALSPVLRTEFNIEGYPDRKFIDLVLQVKPAQVTLVPDPPHVLTSNAGWNTIKNKSFLREVIAEFKKAGIRTSIFIDPDLRQINEAPATGTERIELYTEAYAKQFSQNKEAAVAPYRLASKCAHDLGLGVNAGHDLDLHNLAWFKQQLPDLEEVSIGHALICDALYYGLENTVQLYLRQLK